MKAHIRGRLARLVLTCCLVALGLVVDAGGAYACTPAPPTPWFDTRLKMISMNIPTGISFTEMDYGSLTLQNHRASTIKIPVLRQGSNNSGYEEILPGKAGNISWTGADFGETVSSKEYLYINGSLAGIFDSRNVIQDNRPANPNIPEARVIPLHVLIGESQFDLQLSVNYTLNQYYRSDSVYMFRYGCINWSNQMLWKELAPLAAVCGFVVIWLSVLAAGFYIYVRSGRNKQKKAQ